MSFQKRNHWLQSAQASFEEQQKGPIDSNTIWGID